MKAPWDMIVFIKPQKAFRTLERRRTPNIPNDLSGSGEAQQSPGRFISSVLKKGIDQRCAFLVRLCMEEMAGNIIRHGFRDGKDHMIDVRVAVYPDRLILRLSDDCRPFNPREFMEMTTAKNLDASGNFRNIGIRLVFAVAKHISYNRIMGVNILTIEQ